MEALGISVYLAEHDPQPGTVLAEKVRAAIRRSHAVVVLITTESLNSAYVQQEVGIAHECEKPIIPIVEKGIDTRQLGILQGIEYLESDLAAPADAIAKMTARLQPMVMKEMPVHGGLPATSQPANVDPVMAFLVVGLVVLGGLLIYVLLSELGGA